MDPAFELNQTNHEIIDEKNSVDGNDSDKILSFTPSILRCNLLDDQTENKFPMSLMLNGLCLIVDISGFTRLSGSFCSQGKEGIDKLQKVVNGYMGNLVQIVYFYGGDVIKFAGDALICIFDFTNANSLDVAIMALSCALALVKECTDELTVHVGVSMGELCFGILGGHESAWDLLVSGHCLSELSQCLDDAPSRRIVLTKTAFEFVSQGIRVRSKSRAGSIDINGKEGELRDDAKNSFYFEGEALESSNVLIVDHRNAKDPQIDLLNRMHKISDKARGSTNFQERVSQFVPVPVMNALAAKSFDYLAEIREVTTIFMKWDGYSHTEHKDLMSLQKYFKACQEAVARGGGFLRQFLVDDKGCVLIAMWGVPAATHSDNCFRAVWAAVAMQDRLRSMGMESSLGITTGNIYCGTVGSPLRQEYAGIGDVVNIAARLMSKAKGSIYLDEATFLRLPEASQKKFEMLPEMKVKGKDVPLIPYKFVDMFFDLDSETIDSCRKVLEHDFRNIVQYLLPPSSENHGHGHNHGHAADPGAHQHNILQQFQRNDPRPLGKDTRKSTIFHTSALRAILVEAPTGAGCFTSLIWLKNLAESKDIRAPLIKIHKSDAVLEFSVIRKLFRQLIKEENFDDVRRQGFVINQLLKDIYKNDSYTIENVAYPTMKQVFGVTCNLITSNKKNLEFTRTNKKLPHRLITECVQEIFKHIFTQQPVLILLGNVHFMDEGSWKIINDFVDFRVRIGLVITKLQDDFNVMVFNKQDFIRYDWTDSNIEKAKTLMRVVHINLTSLTLEEIKSLMKIRLKHSCHKISGQSEAEIANLVHELAGGSFFWAAEVIEFIKANGIEGFLSTVKSEDSSHHDSSPSTPTTSASTAIALSTTSTSAMDPTVMTSKLTALIISRFSKLTNEEQQVAKSASVVGKDITADVLVRTLPHRLREKVDEYLESLEKQSWLRSYIDSNDQTRYSFAHHLFQSTLYECIPTSTVKQLHLHIAEYLCYHKTEEPDFLATAAYHFCRSGTDRRLAFEYSSRAAFEIISTEFGSFECCMMFIKEAEKFADLKSDLKTLIGILHKAFLRLDEKRKQNEPPTPHGSTLALFTFSMKKSIAPIPETVMSASQKEIQKKLKRVNKELKTLLANKHEDDSDMLQSWQEPLIALYYLGVKQAGSKGGIETAVDSVRVVAKEDPHPGVQNKHFDVKDKNKNKSNFRPLFTNHFSVQGGAHINSLVHRLRRSIQASSALTQRSLKSNQRYGENSSESEQMDSTVTLANKIVKKKNFELFKLFKDSNDTSSKLYVDGSDDTSGVASISTTTPNLSKPLVNPNLNGRTDDNGVPSFDLNFDSIKNPNQTKSGLCSVM